ncbi:hypothetical protein [Hydrocarboniphaga effusa]|uniref:hypothetical protein n=1 Tax=Hydrocarboniphaga effusa TaxID=243629 RepID=UPI0035B21A55
MRARGFAWVALPLSLASIGVQAQPSDLEAAYRHCRTLADASSRLGCFDRLLPTPTTDAMDEMPTAAPPVATAPAAAPTVPAPAVPRPPGQAAFGTRDITRPAAEEAEPDQIETRVLGPLDRIIKGNRYTLENGQVWLNIDDRDVDVDFNSPAVTIEKNVLGNYWMRFHDRNLRVRVRRIQ